MWFGRIPNLQLSTNEEGQVDIELSDDPYDYTELDVDMCPLLITCSKVSDTCCSLLYHIS